LQGTRLTTGRPLAVREASRTPKVLLGTIRAADASILIVVTGGKTSLGSAIVVVTNTLWAGAPLPIPAAVRVARVGVVLGDITGVAIKAATSISNLLVRCARIATNDSGITKVD